MIKPQSFKLTRFFCRNSTLEWLLKINGSLSYTLDTPVREELKKLGRGKDNGGKEKITITRTLCVNLIVSLKSLNDHTFLCHCSHLGSLQGLLKVEWGLHELEGTVDELLSLVGGEGVAGVGRFLSLLSADLHHHLHHISLHLHHHALLVAGSSSKAAHFICLFLWLN